MRESLDSDEEFEELWSEYFALTVKGEDALLYILNRTIMRPRDLLLLMQRVIETAINRCHDIADESDFEQAARSTSEDLAISIDSEIADTNRDLKNILFAFESASYILDESQVCSALSQAGYDNELHDRAIDVLLWFGFLGILKKDDTEVYSYEVQYSIPSLKVLLKSNGSTYVIHPGFRPALNIIDS